MLGEHGYAEKQKRLEPVCRATPVVPVPMKHTIRDVEDYYSEYRQTLMAYFRRRLPADEDPEDMTQQVFFRLAEGPDLKAVQHPRGLIFRVAVFVLRDLLRRRKTHHVPEHQGLDHDELVSESPTQDDVLAHKQKLRFFMRKLDELPPKCKQAFILHRMKHLPHAEVAKAMGISVSTVEKHMIRAIAHLNTSMENF